MMDEYGAFYGIRIGNETEILKGNLSQCHCFPQISHMT
jgi:hypothetical protein